MAPAKSAKSIPLTVQEYTVLPLTIAPVPSFPKPTIHYLYLRHNAPKVPTPTTDRELFVVNVPIDATETHFRSLFADHLGGVRVERVDFEGARVGRKTTAPVAPQKAGRKRKRGADGDDAEVGLPDVWDREARRSGSTAVVTLVDRASAEVAMKEARRAAKSRTEVPWGQGVQDKVPPLGSARYAAHHALRYPSAVTLQRNVDAFMAGFAAAEAERTRMLARQRQQPDEDGFITVTRGGRVGPAREEEAKEKMEKQKERQKGKEDFYRFQIREKRKERAGELLRGFEEDRKKVDEMRKRRNKFRPN
ncbi:hypothetical protein H2203_004477 [Taxawa tesnikishii (nom. ined.)]|nr:hypothetical protein H2203_004477 [Dothideales sp. JES 119]